VRAEGVVAEAAVVRRGAVGAELRATLLLESRAPAALPLRGARLLLRRVGHGGAGPAGAEEEEEGEGWGAAVARCEALGGSAGGWAEAGAEGEGGAVVLMAPAVELRPGVTELVLSGRAAAAGEWAVAGLEVALGRWRLAQDLSRALRHVRVCTAAAGPAARLELRVEGGLVAGCPALATVALEAGPCGFVRGARLRVRAVAAAGGYAWGLAVLGGRVADGGGADGGGSGVGNSSLALPAVAGGARVAASFAMQALSPPSDDASECGRAWELRVRCGEGGGAGAGAGAGALGAVRVVVEVDGEGAGGEALQASEGFDCPVAPPFAAACDALPAAALAVPPVGAADAAGTAALVLRAELRWAAAGCAARVCSIVAAAGPGVAAAEALGGGAVPRARLREGHRLHVAVLAREEGRPGEEAGGRGEGRWVSLAVAFEAEVADARLAALVGAERAAREGMWTARVALPRGGGGGEERGPDGL
jgi:hypothetical protein